MRLRSSTALALSLPLLVSACGQADTREAPATSAPQATSSTAGSPRVTPTDGVAAPAAEAPSPEPMAAGAAEPSSDDAPPAEPAAASARASAASSARAEARTANARGSDDATGDDADEGEEEAPRYTAEQLEAAARHALGAAAEDGSGDNDCETAYARLKALMTTIEREAPGTVQPLPPEDRFLAVCAGLPLEMQRCLVVEYAIAHEAECTRLHAALEPAARARLDGLMTAGGQAR
jgi:hypothetical protein